MKRTTIYWILFFGLLAMISWMYTSLNDYTEPILQEIRSNKYQPAHVGDFYLKKDSLGGIQRFFKVIETTKYGRAVYIAEGNPSFNNNFLKEGEIRNGIERPMYFEDQLKKVSEEYLVNLEANSNNYSIYRLGYPPKEIPIAFKIFYSPLFIVMCVGLLFMFIWLGDHLSVYLNGRYKWILQGGIFFLCSTIAVSVISLLQVQIVFSLEKNAETQMVMTIPHYLSMIHTSSMIAFLALPFFLLFKYLKAKHFRLYRFADREFFNFLFLFIGGSCYLSIVVLSLYMFGKFHFGSIWGSDKNSFSQLFQLTISVGVITCSIIAIANFLNNLRKHVLQLKLKEALLNQSDKTALSAQSALNALQAKVNPHFLYNSLNSIASLAQTNPAKTEEMALALSDFYKHSTNRQEEHLSTLTLELKQLQSYLDIEKIRFSERLQYEFDIDEKAMKTEIPRFLLQPLVENAIKYGFNKRDNKISITIQVEQIAHQLHLKIMDSGEPFSGEMNTGYGLRSIKKKLKLLYPNAHELHFINKPIKQVHIILDSYKNQLYA